MRYNEPLILRLFTYSNGEFVQQASIDDYQEISFSHNLYEAGDFTITINYNIPNALKFERGMFIQFGNDPYMFGEILTISDSIGEDGKGSQQRTITGKDARFIFKRRIIKNLNNEENWAMTDKGEICLRELVKAQCGAGAEAKRQLPVANTIPESANAIGKEYSVAEAFSNLYDTLVTIATQSEIGWRIKFDGTLTLEVYEGSDLSSSVQFSTDYDSLSNGEFTDSSESFANTIYVGGKGTGSDRDIYEGEVETEGATPEGMDRFEAWDNQSSMTSESEYEAEAFSMLTQYGQTLNISGQGLAKCPYIFKEQYNIGDTITLTFSGKSAKAQILSVTENWTWGQYGISFSFGKPQNDLSRQLLLILKQIQKASNKTTTTSSVKYYTIPTDTSQPKADVIYDRIGFVGNCASGGSTFQLYYDSEKTGAKTYHIYFKQLGGGNLTLTTGVSGKSNLVLNSGTYVAIVYVDQEGNVLSQGATPTNTIQAGNVQPAESGAVAQSINNVVSNFSDLPTDAVIHYSFDDVPDYPDGTAVYFRNKNFVASEYTTIRCTLSVSDGIIKAQNTSSNSSFIGNTYWKYGNLTGKILKAKVFIHDVRTDGATSILRLSAYGTLNDVSIPKDKWVEVTYVIGTDSQASTDFSVILGARFLSESTENYFMLESLYIGNGSYNTPIIDNSGNGNNATNNGGIAVQGVSGKGVWLSNKTVNMGAYNLTPNFTISIWVKPDNNTSALLGNIYNKSGQVILRNGVSWRNTLMIYLYGETSTLLDNYNIGDLLPPNEWTNIVLVRNGTSFKVYRNGVQTHNVVLADGTIRQNTNDFIIGNSNNTRSQSLDDLLIFNRALSEQEVQALYLNKANTPKYVDFLVDSIPIQNSTNLITSGGVFDSIQGDLKNLGFINNSRTKTLEQNHAYLIIGNTHPINFGDNGICCVIAYTNSIANIIDLVGNLSQYLSSNGFVLTMSNNPTNGNWLVIDMGRRY